MLLGNSTSDWVMCSLHVSGISVEYHQCFRVLCPPQAGQLMHSRGIEFHLLVLFPMHSLFTPPDPSWTDRLVRGIGQRLKTLPYILLICSFFAALLNGTVLSLNTEMPSSEIRMMENSGISLLILCLQGFVFAFITEKVILAVLCSWWWLKAPCVSCMQTANWRLS